MAMGDTPVWDRAHIGLAALVPVLDVMVTATVLVPVARLVFRHRAPAVLWLCTAAMASYGLAGSLALVTFRLVLPAVALLVVLSTAKASVEEAGRFLDWLQFLERGRSPPSLHGGKNGPWVDAIVDGFLSFASRRFGALLVVKGRDHLQTHLTGGIPLGGRISQELLLSLFDPHSPGHDGAVIVQGGRFAQFGVQLPLSRNITRPERFGTRHAAALGLAERTDALVLVASEETGQLRIAEDGKLIDVVDGAELKARLQSFLRRTQAPGGEQNLQRRPSLRVGWHEALGALSLALSCHLFLGATLR